MSTQELIDLNNPANINIYPDYLNNFQSKIGKLSISKSRNRISLNGKEFHIYKNSVLDEVIDDKHLDVVLLGISPTIMRVYYKDTYEEKKISAPVCYSADGLSPAPDVKSKQSILCGKCVHTVACRKSRRMAVYIAGDSSRTVYQMNAPAKSLWGDYDKHSSFYNFDDYAKKLDGAGKNGIPADGIITRLIFSSGSFPILRFSAARALTPQELEDVLYIQGTSQIEEALEVSMRTVDLSDEKNTQTLDVSTVSIDDEEEQPQKVAPKKVQSVTKPKPVTPPQPISKEIDEEDEDLAAILERFDAQP